MSGIIRAERIMAELEQSAFTLEEMAKVLRGAGYGGCASICETQAARARETLKE